MKRLQPIIATRILALLLWQGHHPQHPVQAHDVHDRVGIGSWGNESAQGQYKGLVRNLRGSGYLEAERGADDDTAHRVFVDRSSQRRKRQEQVDAPGATAEPQLREL